MYESGNQKFQKKNLLSFFITNKSEISEIFKIYHEVNKPNSSECISTESPPYLDNF